MSSNFTLGQTTTTTTTTTAPKPSSVPGPDRYVQIHKNLKQLRASLAEQAKTSQPLKQRLGSMRRELRKNLGQLVGEKGGNKKQARVSLPPLSPEYLAEAEVALYHQ